MNRQVSIRLSEEDTQEVDKLAFQTNRTRSQMIQFIIKKFLELYATGEGSE